MSRFLPIHQAEDLVGLVDYVGILPFFPCGIPGWSLEENCDASVWFTDRDGPWEWKGSLTAEGRLVYGRFFQGKNVFVSRSLFPELANYRRDGYDFEGFYEDGLAPFKDKKLMTCLERGGAMQSRQLRKECGVDKGYDACLARLQMGTWVVNRDFVYSRDKQGRPYGWGNALLDLPERFFGEEWLEQAEKHSAAESLDILLDRLNGIMPDIGRERFAQALKK